MYLKILYSLNRQCWLLLVKTEQLTFYIFEQSAERNFIYLDKWQKKVRKFLKEKCSLFSSKYRCICIELTKSYKLVIEKWSIKFTPRRRAIVASMESSLTSQRKKYGNVLSFRNNIESNNWYVKFKHTVFRENGYIDVWYCSSIFFLLDI